MDRYAVLADQREARLDSPRLVRGVAVHRRESQSTPLVEPQRAQVVVGRDQPYTIALEPSRFGHDGSEKRGADSSARGERVEVHQLALPVMNIDRGDADSLSAA